MWNHSPTQFPIRSNQEQAYALTYFLPMHLPAHIHFKHIRCSRQEQKCDLLFPGSYQPMGGWGWQVDFRSYSKTINTGLLQTRVLSCTPRECAPSLKSGVSGALSCQVCLEGLPCGEQLSFKFFTLFNCCRELIWVDKSWGIDKKLSSLHNLNVTDFYISQLWYPHL